MQELLLMLFLMVTLNAIILIHFTLMVLVLHVGLLVNMFGHLLHPEQQVYLLEVFTIVHALPVAHSKFLCLLAAIITVNLEVVIHSGMAKAV